MSQNEGFNPLDPTGMLKLMRDNSMDAWAKMMIELVHTEAYAKATGVMLDAWLSSSQPFQKALESTMEKVLTNLSMPIREDIIRVAERLTNIEMRLDDIEAKLDEGLRAVHQGSSKRKSKHDNK